MEKGGLTDALQTEGIGVGARIGFGDEMLVSRHGMLSRVLAPRGIAVTQPCQGERESVYLSLCVDGIRGTFSWLWIACMHHTEIALGVHQWKTDGLDAVIWDNASSHGHAVVQAVGVPLIGQPTYAPELNPAERVFEELRKVVKGQSFPRLEEKVLLVENTLREWQADPARIQRLCGWQWIRDAINALACPTAQAV